MKLHWLRHCWITAAALPLAWTQPAHGASPTVTQILAVRPAHADVPIDNPRPSDYSRLKLSPFRSGRMSGWILRDPSGKLLRFFLDTNGDNMVDQWRFYRDGQEVYRDLDTNRNGRPDQHRWFNEGGTRWAVDVDEDGRIDSYRVMSLEELLAALAQALQSGQYDALRPLVATGADLAGRAAPSELSASLRSITPQTFRQLRQSLQKLGTNLQIERVDLTPPATLPGPAIDGSTDLTVYRHLMIVIRGSGGQMEVMELPWLVKVGAAWKLASLPQPAGQRPSAPVAQPSPETDQLDRLIEELQRIDQQLTATSSTVRQGQLHLERAKVLKQIAEASPQDQADMWWRQAIDSILLAQEKGVVQAAQELQALRRQLSQSRPLMAYLEFHELTSRYARRFREPGTDFMKVQRQYLADLEAFVRRYRDTAEAAEALLQLGLGYELIGETEKAMAAFDQIVAQYRNTDQAAKAQGALRRLGLTGKPMPWNLLGLSPTQTYALRGKHVVVYFWAPWCEPCKEDLRKLAQLQQRFGATRLEVVSIVLDRDLQGAKGFLRQIGGSRWTVIHGREGMNSEAATAFGVFSLPTALLVGPDGKVIDRNATVAEIQAALERKAARR